MLFDQHNAFRVRPIQPLWHASIFKLSYTKSCPREESNLHYKVRNLASYPLNDEDGRIKDTSRRYQKHPCFSRIVPSEGIACKFLRLPASNSQAAPRDLLATSLVAYRCGLRFPHASEAIRSLSDSIKMTH